MTPKRGILRLWCVAFGVVLIIWAVKLLAAGPGATIDPTWPELALDIGGLVLAGLTLIMRS